MLKKLTALIAAIFATASVAEEPNWETVFKKTKTYSCALMLPGEIVEDPEFQFMPAFVDFNDPPGLYLSKPFMGGQETRIPLTYITSAVSENRGQLSSSFTFVAALEGEGVLILDFETRLDEVPTEFFKISFWTKENDPFKGVGKCELPPKGILN